MSSAFKLTKISIAMLGVTNLERSIEFYRDRLGLPLQNQIPGFAFFGAGDITLAISEPIARANPNLSGATELVFPVESVRGAYEALQAQGVVFSIQPRIVTGTQFAANFKDPDGHGLSIFGPE